MAVMPIEWGKVREYAMATAAARPAYVDDPAAPIPPTFLATVVWWTPVGDTLRAPEVVRACAEAGVPADVRNLLSLEQEYVFHGDVPRAGEELAVENRFDEAVVKRKGMVILRYVLEFRDPASGALRAECRYTSAYRQAA